VAAILPLAVVVAATDSLSGKLNMPRSRALLALTASALALPGMTPQVKADAAPTTSTVAYRYSSYEEDPLDKRVLLVGSQERYDIQIHQLSLLTPLGESTAVNVVSSVESMSGASPWYTISGISGDPQVVMSGASISEQRRDISATVRRYLNNGTLGFTLATSHENDYRSLSGGVDMDRHFNNDLTTLATGFSFSSDDLSPTDATLFNRILDASKQSRSVFVSISQILNQSSVLQSGLSITHLAGYLTDPYKLADRRPDSRTQLAWSTAYRKFFGSMAGALHADYRFYHDSFGINSHTLDLAWYQNIGDTWQLVPGLRYYSQSAAGFFTVANDFVGSTPNSSDFRLSAYGAYSYSLKIQLQVEAFTLTLSGERYLSDNQAGTWSGPASPALVDFTRLSFGASYSF